MSELGCNGGYVLLRSCHKAETMKRVSLKERAYLKTSQYRSLFSEIDGGDDSTEKGTSFHEEALK
jgi:hypothetical protein